MIEPDDLERLAHEVRLFLGKSNWRNRIVGMAKLYLELPDVGAMCELHRQIMCSLNPAMLAVSRDSVRYVDDETVEIEVGGISVILTCKQRFALKDGGTVGYAGVQVTQVRLPPYWQDDEKKG